MARLVAIISLNLDGVMQAPGRPDADRRGGFEHGGWALAYNDPVMMQAGRIQLHLVESVTTTTGVVIATYNPDPPAPMEGR